MPEAAAKDTGLGPTALAVGLLGITLFVRRQLRLPVPLLDVRLFTVRYFRGAVITDLPAILAMAGALPALTQHLQLVLGLSPLRTSFWLMPQAILAAAAFVGAALVKRHPPAHVITGGLLTTATGFGLAVFPADLLDRASSTLAEALIVAGEVGGGTGNLLLLAAAKEAFSEAATVTGIAGAGVMVVAAIWALVTLRGVSANLDLAEEHARQLH
ncbi:hypothetical protein ACFWEB_13115 [Streptomyces parvus]|uniref:hypothetical protein n=1 Tax=Streptomyces parvus TaxID=66428 RepID=UPI00365BE819